MVKKKIIRSFAFCMSLILAWTAIFLAFLKVFGKVEGISSLFSLIYALGHGAEFGFLLFFFALFTFFLPRKLHSILMIFSGTIIGAYLLLDFAVYAQFRLHISYPILCLYFGSASKDIFAFPPTMYLLAAFIFAGIIAAVTFLWIRTGTALEKKQSKFFKVIGIMAFLSFISYHFVHGLASFMSYNPITSQMAALPASYPFSFNRFLMKHGFKPADSSPKFNPKTIKYPLAPVAVKKNKKLNVVVIMLDAWRSDMLNEEITPNIHKFSRSATQFRNHSSNANHTRHGVFSFFYGIPGIYWETIKANTIGPVLMDTFIGQDYDFGIFASASLTSPEFHKTVFVNVKNLQLHTEGTNAPARDEKITENFLNFLKTRNKSRPFFSFLFYDSTHAYAFDKNVYPPKFLPIEEKNYLALNKNSHKKEWLNQYKNAIGFVDVLVKQVLDALEKDGLLKNTVVLISADHGEEFDDLGQGYWGHNGNFSKYQTQVPMILFWPKKDPAICNYRTSHLDVAPTLIGALRR